MEQVTTNLQMRGLLGSESEGQMPSQRSRAEQQLYDVLNRQNVISGTWGNLSDNFYDAVEDKRVNNHLADALMKGNVTSEHSEVNEYPINVSGDYSHKTVDTFIINSLRHYLIEYLTNSSSKKTTYTIPIDLESCFISGETNIDFIFGGQLPKNKKDAKFKEYDKWKRTNKLDQGQVMQLKIQVDKIGTHTCRINDFVHFIAKAKGVFDDDFNIRHQLQNLNIKHPYDLGYLCIAILSRNIKPRYVPCELVYEIVLALNWAIANVTIKVDLYEMILGKIIEIFPVTPSQISLSYSQGITNPIMVNTMKSKGSGISLLPCQVDMIGSIDRISNQYVRSLINTPNHDNFGQTRERVAIATGLATGKSTIASLIPTRIVQEHNNSKKDGDSHGVVLFVIPSHMTAADFAVIAEKIGATWLARAGVIIPMHSTCPQIKYKSKKNPIRPDKFAEKGKANDGMDTSVGLLDQMQQLVNYTGQGNYKREKYLLPTTIFADPRSAAEILSHQDAWSERFNIKFLPIVDEVVATGDVTTEHNMYIETIAEIINNFNKFGIVISATLTEKQLTEYKIFDEECQVDVVTGGQSCTTFTQMYDHSGNSLQPLQNMLIGNLPSFVNDISSTLLRCFTPKVYDAIKKAYDKESSDSFPDLDWTDVSSASSFLKATERLLVAIETFSLTHPEKAQAICRTEVNIPQIEIKGNSTTMQLTTANPMKHIIKMPQNPITQDKLEKHFDAYENSIKNDISELRALKSTVEHAKESDQMHGSSTNISEKIVEKEQLLRERHNWTICIPSQFGSVNVSTAWADKHSHLDKRLFASLLCGLELEFDNLELDNAIAELKPKPFHVIDTIAGMYGRNVKSCAEVKIFGKDISWDTIAQAAARAGRELSNNAIVSLYIDRELLNSDPHKKSIASLKQYINALNITEAQCFSTAIVSDIEIVTTEVTTGPEINSDLEPVNAIPVDTPEDIQYSIAIEGGIRCVGVSEIDRTSMIITEDSDSPPLEHQDQLDADDLNGCEREPAPSSQQVIESRSLPGSHRRANKNRKKKKNKTPTTSV